MAFNTFKCNSLTPLQFEGLNVSEVQSYFGHSRPRHEKPMST